MAVGLTLGKGVTAIGAVGLALDGRGAIDAIDGSEDAADAAGWVVADAHPATRTATVMVQTANRRICFVSPKAMAL